MGNNTSTVLHMTVCIRYKIKKQYLSCDICNCTYKYWETNARRGISLCALLWRCKTALLVELNVRYRHCYCKVDSMWIVKSFLNIVEWHVLTVNIDANISMRSVFLLGCYDYSLDWMNNGGIMDNSTNYLLRNNGDTI